MKKLRKNDEVIVIAGRDKGKCGPVLEVRGQWVIVDGINLVQKHVKPNPMKSLPGGMESKLMLLHLSNVALVDANGKASRVRIEVTETGEKRRILKTTGAEVALNK